MNRKEVIAFFGHPQTALAFDTHFLCVKTIPGRQLKIKEIKSEASSSFEYKEDQYRAIVEDYHLRDFFRDDC